MSYRCKRVVQSCGFGECLLNSLPIARWLPSYNLKRDLVGDLVAGATTAVMHIPQGKRISQVRIHFSFFVRTYAYSLVVKLLDGGRDMEFKFVL